MGKTRSSSLVEKARSFSRVLSLSEEFQQYYSLQEKVENDPEGQFLLEQFEKKRHELRDAMQQGRRRHDHNLYAEIKEIQDKIRANEAIMNWLQAKQHVVALIREANDVISSEAGFDFGGTASSNFVC